MNSPVQQALQAVWNDITPALQAHYSVMLFMWNTVTSLWSIQDGCSGL